MIQLFRGPDLQFDIRMDGAMQLHMHKQQSTTINLLTTQHTTVIRNDEQFHCDKEKKQSNLLFHAHNFDYCQKEIVVHVWKISSKRHLATG